MLWTRVITSRVKEIDANIFSLPFVDAFTHLYERVFPSVGPRVRPFAIFNSEFH